MNFHEFQTTEKEVSLALNEEGRRHIDYIVDNYANFDIVSEDQYEALSQSDFGFEDDGVMQLELPGHQTKDGKPFAYTLEFDEHFTARYND